MDIIKNMKSKQQAIVALGAALALLLSREVFAVGLPEGVAPPPFAPDRVLVAFQPGTPSAEVARAHGRAGAQVIEAIKAIGVQVVAVLPGTVRERVALYQRNPNVEFAEPDYNRLLVLPAEGTDSVLGMDYFDEQWALHNTGQLFYCIFGPGFCGYIGTADADIDAPAAWDITKGSSSIKIAVLDSKVSCKHVDLNGKCVETKNFVKGYPTTQTIGHGTHVAGIAAAKTDNNVGIAGVGWNTRIGSLQVCYETYVTDGFFLYPVGICPVSASAKAITYAADHGYRVINMSYGSDPSPNTPSETEEAAVKYAWGKGVVLVAAAGNDGAPDQKVYPAGYDDYVIAVAATDEDDSLTSFSNYGTWVDIAAPGNVILSTLPGSFCGIRESHPEGCYEWYSGTSMAAPHVAGIAALVWERLLVKDPSNANNTNVRRIIESTTDDPTGFHDPNGMRLTNWIAHGRLNACKAVAAADGGSTTNCEGGVP